jgi:catechol 2,3-dioxygenase-like lactoylglutathione lyase family enzyme
MIGYVTVGTNDFEAALEFYDGLFSSIGVDRLWKHGHMAAWGQSRETPALCIACPFDGAPASAGNGVMIALRMADTETVDTIHAQAVARGGADEGSPGPRGDHGFYGGYFRDLEGNKICAYVPA